MLLYCTDTHGHGIHILHRDPEPLPPPPHPARPFISDFFVSAPQPTFSPRNLHASSRYLSTETGTA